MSLFAEFPVLADLYGLDRNFVLRTSLELILAFLALKYITSKNVKEGAPKVQLSKKEIEELIEDWAPEPLVPSHEIEETFDKAGSVDFCSLDYHGVVGNQKIIEEATQALREYGVGTCGPPGFYGTMDKHLDLEKRLAEHFGTEKAILYAQGFAAVASVIPAFSKRGDIIVHDEAVNYSIISGIKVSRSYAFSFKHNDYKDLEAILEEVEQRYGSHKQARKFIIVESLYANTGRFCDIQKIALLKKKYKYRLILDNSTGLGASDPTGIQRAGNTSDIDILVGSLSLSAGGAGGYCAGSEAIIDHQRLLSSAYCFSASLPVILAVAATNGVDRLEAANFEELRSRIVSFKNDLKFTSTRFELSTDCNSPLFVIRSRADGYSSRAVDTRQLYKFLLTKGYHLSMVTGTRIERKSKFFPFIRLAISSNHLESQLSGLASELSKI